jgi:hypothetical protein
MVDWKKLSDDQKLQHLTKMGAEIQAAKRLLDEFEQLTAAWIGKVHARQNGKPKPITN